MIRKSLFIISFISALFVSCVGNTDMKVFYSLDCTFSLLLPSKLKIIDSTKTSIKLIPDYGANSWQGEIKVECLYLSDLVKERLTIAGDERLRYNSMGRILKSNDSIIFVPTNNDFGFKKKIGDICYIFDADNIKFTYNELLKIYNSVTEHSTPKFNMSAIGNIELGCTQKEFQVQKAKFLKEYPKLGNYEIDDIIPTFVNDKLAAIAVNGKKMFAVSKNLRYYPKIDWHEYYDQKYRSIPTDRMRVDGVGDFDYMYLDGCKTILVSQNLLYSHTLLYWRKPTYPCIYIENSIIMDKVRRNKKAVEKQRVEEHERHTLNAI